MENRNSIKTLVIGTGAAGNKAAISLIESSIMKKEDIVLINSAITDIPDVEKYKNCFVQLKQESGEIKEGCGKERGAGIQLTKDSIEHKYIDIEKMIKGYEKVIIVTSLEGGTGSGSSLLIAEEIIKRTINEIGPFIELYLFEGFKKDIRGLQNTTEYFENLKQSIKNLQLSGLRHRVYRVQTIRNSEFLEEAKDELGAQKLANEEFCRRVMISLGTLFNGENNANCNNNIDRSDLCKAASCSGYGTVEFISVKDEILSKEDYNKLVTTLIESTKSIPIESKPVLRVTIFGNLRRTSRANVDYTHKVLVDKFGVKDKIFEVFDQFYTDDNAENFLGLIVGGAKLPINAMKSIKKEYQNNINYMNEFDDFVDCDDDELEEGEELKIISKFDMIKDKPKNVIESNNFGFTGTFGVEPNIKKIKNKNEKLKSPSDFEY